jgi:hypothetical protein
MSEVEFARFLYTMCVKNNMDMKEAYEHEQEEYRKGKRVKIRSKRNIFGSIISMLTGLATSNCGWWRRHPNFFQ